MSFLWFAALSVRDFLFHLILIPQNRVKRIGDLDWIFPKTPLPDKPAR